MEMVKMVRQMIDFHKSFSDNTYDVMMTLLEQGARMANTMLAGATWIPNESKRAVNESMSIYRKGCEDMKSILDEGFKSLQELFAEADRSTLLRIIPVAETPQ